jgi:hypothetical protein
MTTNEVIGLMGRPVTIVPDMIGETWTWKHVTKDHLGVPGSKAVAVQIRNGRVFAVRKP